MFDWNAPKMKRIVVPGTTALMIIIGSVLLGVSINALTNTPAAERRSEITAIMGIIAGGVMILVGIVMVILVSREKDKKKKGVTETELE